MYETEKFIHISASLICRSSLTQMLSLPISRLRCRPKQGIYNILPKRREQSIPHFQHIVEDIQLDHGLTLDQMVHHGRVNIAHEKGATDEDGCFDNVADLGRTEE